MDMLVFAALALASNAALAGGTVFENWSEETATVNIAKDGRKGWIKALPVNGEKKGRFLGMLGRKSCDLSKVKTGFNEGRFVVDTMECDFSEPKSFIQVQFAMPLNDMPCGRKIDFTVEMKAMPGAHWLMGHNGPFTEEAALFDKQRQRKKTSYWNNRPVMAEDGSVRYYVYSHAVPCGLKNLMFDIRLETPGVFEFGRISWEVSKDTDRQSDPKLNLIVNGGAERGWYGTAMANAKSRSETGKYLGQDGHWFTTSTEPAIDTAEKHSGRASFRFHIDHDRDSIPAWGPYNMEFCAVPVVPGKPLVFTCWAKADRNGRRMNLRLAVESEGGAYNANLKLTTEWKRYRLLVKSVGEKQPGCYGNLGAYSSYGLYVPRLDFVSPGTFWVDNCGVFQAEDGDYELEPICASGAINKKSAIYYAGERIEAKLKVDGKCSVSSKAFNYRGETVATTAERTVAPKSGAAEIVEELKLPAAFRGPVQWLFTVKAGDGAAEQTVGFNFGVIDSRKPLLKRFGYNLYHTENIQRTLEMFRDFRIGSVRIWDDAIHTERRIEEIRRFHEAGIDVLYCYAFPGVLPRSKRHLVVKDPTEWQNHIAYIATNVLGEVYAYEIINEPNALAGLGKNPDPGKYDDLNPESNAWCIKVASEAIRRYDKKALIVGPTTCKTDLGWTFEVLRRGAAEHLDVISEHPYFAVPEVQDYAKKVETLIREGSRMKGRHMPSWATERGKTTPANPKDGCIYPLDVNGAARNVRTMIISFAGGSERFFDFRLGSYNTMFQYMSLHNGNQDNDCTARPSCLLYAQRALMDLIEDAPCVKELNVGVACRAYVFDRGDRRVVAIWKFTGDPRTVKLPRKALVYDFMGTPSRREELVLDIFPQYMVTKAPVDKIEGVFAKLDFGADAVAVEEKREQLKVPFFEKNVDWSKAAVVRGKKADAGAAWNKHMPANEPKGGDALEVRLAWNRSGLMMRAIVEKDGFHPGGENVMNLWKGDGLQIAFDTMKNAQKIATGYDDEDFEYDFAMFNGNPTVFRRKASLAYHDSLHKPLGVVDDVALDIAHEGRKTIYTIKFSPQSISPFRLDKGESMRFAVLANLNDGKTRYGALETSPGILVSGKWPYGFQELVLEGEGK